MPLPLFLRAPSAWIAVALAGVLVVLGFADLLMRFHLEWVLPYDGDNILFLTVGRGIVNGLTPYKDLFETKSPAIFLIAAASWFVTDSTALARALQIAVLVGIALVFWWMAWRTRIVAHSRPWRWFAALLAIGMGLTMALYTGESAGLLFPESFGALFAILYLAIIAPRSSPLSFLRIVAAGIAFGVAIAFKEPFLLTIFAAVLVLYPSPRAWPRVFLLPALIGCALWALTLLLLGYLGVYLHIFLPMIFDPYFSKNIGILWRGSYWIMAALSLTAYSWPFFIGVFLAFVAAGVLALERRTIASVAMFCTTLALTLTAAMFLPLYFNAGRMPIGIASVAFLYLALLVPVSFLGAAPGHRGGLYVKLCAFLAAGYIGIMAAATGGAGVFLAHHFVYVLPLFAALLLQVWRAGRGSHAWAIVAGLITSSLLLSLQWHRPFPDAATIATSRAGHAATLDAARDVDALLDACGWDRYLSIGSVGGLYGYTRHSPLGPGFMQAKFNRYLPYFEQTFVANLRTTPVIVITKDIDVEPDVAEILRMRFGAPVPSCAKDIPVPSGLLYLFAEE